MFGNILRLSLRNFFRNKIYSGAIVLSLALGFSVSAILIGFIIHELNTDDFISKKDRIFRLISEDPFNRNSGSTISFIRQKTVDYLSENYPEIESTCIVYPLKHYGVSRINDIEEIPGLKILSVDSSFFSLFDFPFYMGSRLHAVDYNNLVLTYETAQKLFGDSQLNYSEVEIRLDSGISVFNISGLTKKPPENSHLQFDGIVPRMNRKPDSGGVTYLLLHKGAKYDELEDKFNASGRIPGMMGEGKINYYLQPLKNVYWDEQNSRTFSRARSKIFLWIGVTTVITILFLAVFNFLNLFIVLFISRWKEFGIKKILGAGIGSIRMIAVIEVFFYIIISLVCTIILIRILLPWFDNLVGTGLSFIYFLHPRIIGIIVLIIFIIAIATILKMTQYLYKIQPVSLVSGKSTKKIRFNQWMIGIQFVVSIILITITMIMYQQMKFIREKPLGFTRNLLEVRSPSRKLNHLLASLKTKMLKVPGIESASVCSGNPISDNMILRYDLEDESYYTPYLYLGDEDHLKTLGISLISGKLPQPGNQNEKLVNEEFVKYFSLKNPVGEIIPGTSNERICGVVSNFNLSSLKVNIPPVIMGFTSEGDCLLMKYNPDKLSQILAMLKEQWSEIFMDYPFRYLFLTDELNNKHKEDQHLGKMVNAATVISILITCFGLFALSWGTTESRSKEMGIRKVVGASSLDVLWLLLKNIVRWMIIAYIIALPVTWYLSERWLETFSYKIKLNFWIFLISGIVIMAIAFVTVIYHTIKSSLTDPVVELRYE